MPETNEVTGNQAPQNLEGHTQQAAPSQQEGGNVRNSEPTATQDPSKTFSKEDVNNIAVKEAKESENTIFSLQAENAAIKAGITDEKNLNAVITLAKTKVSDDVDITKAIEMVVEEFPQFKGVVGEQSAVAFNR